MRNDLRFPVEKKTYPFNILQPIPWNTGVSEQDEPPSTAPYSMPISVSDYKPIPGQ